MSVVRTQKAAAPAELGYKRKSRRIGRVRGAHGAPTRGVSRWRVAARRFGGRVGRHRPTQSCFDVGRCGAAVDHSARSATDLSHHAPIPNATPVFVSTLVAVPAPSRPRRSTARQTANVRNRLGVLERPAGRSTRQRAQACFCQTLEVAASSPARAAPPPSAAGSDEPIGHLALGALVVARRPPAPQRFGQRDRAP